MCHKKVSLRRKIICPEPEFNLDFSFKSSVCYFCNCFSAVLTGIQLNFSSTKTNSMVYREQTKQFVTANFKLPDECIILSKFRVDKCFSWQVIRVTTDRQLFNFIYIYIYVESLVLKIFSMLVETIRSQLVPLIYLNYEPKILL